MTLSDLGNIGESVGVIAVVVTLIYLAVQIRQNSATARAHIRQSLAELQIMARLPSNEGSRRAVIRVLRRTRRS